MLAIPLAVITMLFAVGWWIAERRGSRWLRRLLAVLTFVGAGWTGYSAAFLAIQGEIVAQQYEHDLLESGMARMEQLAGRGELGKVANAIAAYNRTLAQHPDRHTGAALEMCSALKP